MCGLSGICRIGTTTLVDSDRALLNTLSRAVAHRGPDESDILELDNVGMAFARLSLVAPELGSQPLVSDDERYVLIANGEVYNHRELTATLRDRPRYRTDSDCEVLLYLYRERGLRFLEDVVGMISVVLWDRRERQIIFAKDRFGIKPLFFHQNEDRLVFASEIKALFSDPATPRLFDWDAALTHPSVAAATRTNDFELTTFFCGIESIPAATVMTIDLVDGTRSSHRYWELPGPDESGSLSADDAVEQYRDLLVDAVEACATADTELGLFLSGGLDSAAVLALASRVTPGLHTFTALNASTRLNGDADSAASIAAHFDSPNHQVLFPAEAVPTPDEWQQVLWLSETPMCGPEVYYKWQLHRYARQARPQLRGMLLGAAADEFTAGYSFDMASGGGWSAFGSSVSQLARRGRTHPTRQHWWDGENAPFLRDGALGLGGDVDDAYAEYVAWEHRKVQQYNVWHEDRTAAGSGIEARVPFLDHRLVDFTSRLPLDLRPELLWDKTILRRATSPFLPQDMVDRPKGPFFYGAGVHHTYRTFLSMLEQDGGALIERALDGPQAAQMLDGDALHAAVAELAAQPTSSPQVEIVLRLVNMGLLSGMAEEPPPPMIDAAPVQVMARASDAVDSSTRELELNGPLALTDDRSIGLSPRVLLLSRPEDGTWFLAVDGSIEYELEGDSETLVLLRALEGSTSSIKQICATAGLEPETIRDDVRQLISDGAVLLV